MRNYCVLLCCLFSTFSAFCQTEYRNGFIVKTSGETIKGSLKDAIDEKLKLGIWLRQADGKDQFYDTTTITSFGFDGGNTYYAIKFIHPLKDSAWVTRFGKLLVSGPYSLYSMFDKGAEEFLVKSPEGVVYFMFDRVLTVYNKYEIKEPYENKLSFFAAGCDEAQKIANHIPYTEWRMINYFKFLNSCLFPGSKSEVVYKKAHQKMVPTVFAGGLPLGEQYEATVQFILRFYIPNISKQTSFNTGVYGYLNKRYDYEFYLGQDKILFTTSYVSVPALIQQSFTSGAIQPYIYVGAALQYIKKRSTNYDPQRALQGNFNIGIIAGGGIEANFGNFLVKADWRYETFAHFPVVGIGYKFNK